MPPRTVKNTAKTAVQNKTGATAVRKSLKSQAKPVRSTPPKAELEAVKKADSKPPPRVEAQKAEEKAVEPFQDLNEPRVELEPEKEMTVEDANKEDKESTKDADKSSAEGSEDGVTGKDLENKETDAVMDEAGSEDGVTAGKDLENNETDAVMDEADDDEAKDKEHQDDTAETNVVMGEQSHGDEAAEGAGFCEEGVEGDGSDDQRDVEMPAMVKERIKQKEFEVFVGGLDWDADEEDLKKAFSAVGEVVEIRMARNPKTRKNKGIGFVRFATVEQAKKAVAELKNPRVRGKQCRVTQNQDNETLYVRNICKSWTKQILKKKLTEYGIDNIEKITLTEDPRQEGSNKGFAFLEFPTHLEATNAFKRLQKRDVFFGIDACAKVEFAKCGIEADEEIMSQVKSIFVDGLPPSWDEEQVRDKFQKYGEIEKVQLARNIATAKRKDFGYVDFTTREAAMACIEGVNKNELNMEENKVTLKATLRKPQQPGQSSGVRSRGYGGSRGGRVPWVRGVGGSRWGRVPWVRGVGDSRFGVHERRRFLDERRQPFRRAYDRRRRGPAYVRSDSATRIYREDDAHLDRRATSRVSRQSSYRDDYGHDGVGYSESMRPRRPPYPEERYSHRMNGMAAYNDGAVRDYIGVSGSKRPFSDVDDGLPYPARHSRSRLDYDAGATGSRYGGVSRVGEDSQVGRYGAGSGDGGIYYAAAADSRYGGVSILGQDPQLGYRGVSRVGQDPELGYGADSRAGGINSRAYLPGGNVVEGGAYSSVLNRSATGRGSGSASYY